MLTSPCYNTTCMQILHKKII